MNKIIYYSVLCILLSLIGSLFFFYQESWIIITSPFVTQQEQGYKEQTVVTYKPVTLSIIQANKIKQESTKIIYSNTADNIRLLLNSWFLFLEDEHIINQDNSVISVALSPSQQEAFISLQKYPFESSWSTYKKLMWIESLLKTLRENKIPITSVRILIHHQPLIDDHLNFDISWPITGFLSEQKV